MPFETEKQRRWMWKFRPDLARKWTGKYGSTPRRKKRSRRRKKK